MQNQNPHDSYESHTSVHETDFPSPERGRAAGKINGGLLFIFSFFFPPGTNYMYMGLMKRGLATMCGFFLLIFMIAQSRMPLTMLFSLALPVYIITCMFDGFNLRRRINAGEIIYDNVADILGGIFRNKTVMLVILGILLFWFVGGLLGFAITILGRLIPVVIIGMIIYVLVKKKR